MAGEVIGLRSNALIIQADFYYLDTGKTKI